MRDAPPSRLSLLATLAATLVAGLIATVAPASAAAFQPCAGAMGAPIDVGALVQHKTAAVAHLWGQENVTMPPAEPAAPAGIARVAFPATSFSPGRSPVRGGVGFEYHGTPAGARTACVTYMVRFPEGFDFVKGGKLPGLFGGDDPRGCVADGAVSGFSARLMWRSAGVGELYLYAPGRDTRCGQSIGRGAWTFQPGAWIRIAQRVVMNTPGTADGSVEVWVDGKPAVKAEGLTLGTAAGASVDGVLFATFFGGGDASWATPRDQSVDFADLTLWTAPR